MTSADPIRTLARRLAAAGDATRLSVVCALLRERSACVSELASATGESIATVSHHLRALAREGLVEPRRKGKRVCYTLSRDPFAMELRRLACKYAGVKTGAKK